MKHNISCFGTYTSTKYWKTLGTEDLLLSCSGADNSVKFCTTHEIQIFESKIICYRNKWLATVKFI